MHGEHYLHRVRYCHTADLAAFTPWFVGADAVGLIHRDHVAAVMVPPTPFTRDDGRLTVAGGDFGSRSAAFVELVARLAAAGTVPAPTGEPYPVTTAAGDVLLQLDRAAVPWFGVAARGVHLNGFVRNGRGLSVWVARRARGKRTFPGHLDNLVAGGCALGASAAATLCKEAHEEAGMPAALAQRAVFVGEIAYTQQDGRSLKVDTLRCHDLELPSEFTPRALDGEVESFALWPAERLAASVRGGDPWKPNCALVALHFLLRHGVLDAELGHDERARLWRALHGGR